MDIKQILDQAQDIDFTTLGKEETQDKITELESQIREIHSILASLNGIRNSGANRIYEIQRVEIAEENAKEQERLREQGIKIGDVYYIDRHDGVYVIGEITKDKVTFYRYMDGSTGRHYGKSKIQVPGKFDPRLTPLRTQGPFKVGDTVTRGEQEFTVMGYLGYRMVLKGSKYGSTFYTIVQKKDEKTYRSIIF